MRRALLLVILVSCSKGDNKAAPGSDPRPGAEPASAAPARAEKAVKGALALGGALTASVSWKPDLALFCACLSDKEWVVDATMSDGSDTFVALSVSPAKGISLTSGKLSTPEPARAEAGVGISGGCRPDKRNVDGVIAVDLDAKLTGKAGDVTIKGHLDVVCREGL